MIVTTITTGLYNVSLLGHWPEESLLWNLFLMWSVVTIISTTRQLIDLLSLTYVLREHWLWCRWGRWPPFCPFRTRRRHSWPERRFSCRTVRVIRVLFRPVMTRFEDRHRWKSRRSGESVAVQWRHLCQWRHSSTDWLRKKRRPEERRRERLSAKLWIRPSNPFNALLFWSQLWSHLSWDPFDENGFHNIRSHAPTMDCQTLWRNSTEAQSRQTSIVI